jgi:hypothetical protein
VDDIQKDERNDEIQDIARLRAMSEGMDEIDQYQWKKSHGKPEIEVLKRWFEDRDAFWGASYAHVSDYPERLGWRK